MLRKLLQINVRVNYGSTSRITEEIGHTAIENGWESHIAFGRDFRQSKSNLIKIGNDWDIKKHVLHTRFFDRHGLASKKATLAFVEKVYKLKPDIVHLHNIHGYYINIEVLFKCLKELNCPVVWTLHDCWPITGHCSHFTFVGCDKWKTQCFNCPQKKGYPASYVIDRSEMNYKLKKDLFNSLTNLTLVPVSKWLSGVLSESFLKNHPIKVINNGVNTKVFRPVVNNNIRVKYGFQDKFILLGVASVWTEKKGLKDFIELSQQLDSNYKIVLVGLTKKQIDQLPNNILGIERTENVYELSELYSTSDVFLNATYEDTFPTTNLESQACGTPVITYKTGGSPEAIDESTGIVVEQGNINKLVEAINLIKENGKQYYSDACVKRVNSLYKKEDRFSEYIRLYEDILDRKSQ
jgi:putative colanic acid biosynthesis glycosyltransferase